MTFYILGKHMNLVVVEKNDNCLSIPWIIIPNPSLLLSPLFYPLSSFPYRPLLLFPVNNHLPPVNSAPRKTGNFKFEDLKSRSPKSQTQDNRIIVPTQVVRKTGFDNLIPSCGLNMHYLLFDSSQHVYSNMCHVLFWNIIWLECISLW